MSLFVEENHRIIQKTLLDNTDLKVNNRNIIAHIKRDGFIDAVNILFLTDAIATGTATISLLAGFDKQEIIPNFLKAPVVTSAIASSTTALVIDTSVAATPANLTDTRIRRLGEVVQWIYANKTTGHSITNSNLNEGFYFLAMTVTAGTIDAATKFATEVIIGQ